MNGNDQAGYLGGDGIGIDGSDRADGIQVDADIAFIGGDGGDGDSRRRLRRSRFFNGIFMMAINQKDR